MPAAASRQTGLKRLAAALAPLCLVLFLLAIENRQAIDAWRSLREAVAPAADRVADWAGGLPEDVADGLSDLKTVAARPAIAAADPADAPLAGEFGPADEVTRAVTGSVAFVGAELRFETGDTLQTQPLRIVAAQEAFAAGRTFAGQWRAPADAQIELRSVVAPERHTPVTAARPCAGAVPVSVALLHRRDRVDLMVFRAGAAAGSGATQTTLCGIWSFLRK